MGPVHFSVARRERGAAFRIGTMPVIGMAATQSLDRAVTDSGAAASAMATGEKTIDEGISVAVAEDGTVTSRETVLERAEKLGKATGLVTTTAFFDATPAAFAAHQRKRGDFALIVPQMLRSGVDVILSAGASSFGTARLQPLAEFVVGTGFTVVSNRAELEATTAEKVLGVFASQPRDIDNPEVPLPLLARWAIDRLRKDPEGFFLMIEHEGTDSASHQNNAADLLSSLKSFDEAVGAALDFAQSRNDTLVVVTGDHETGAFRISETRLGRWRYEFTTVDHTGVAVPIFAYGPGSAAFGKFMENSDLGKLLLAAVATPAAAPRAQAKGKR
jgi:alkaline phosphatase